MNMEELMGGGVTPNSFDPLISWDILDKEKKKNFSERRSKMVAGGFETMNHNTKPSWPSIVKSLKKELKNKDKKIKELNRQLSTKALTTSDKPPYRDELAAAHAQIACLKNEAAKQWDEEIAMNAPRDHSFEELLYYKIKALNGYWEKYKPHYYMKDKSVEIYIRREWWRLRYKLEFNSAFVYCSYFNKWAIKMVSYINISITSSKKRWQRKTLAEAYEALTSTNTPKQLTKPKKISLKRLPSTKNNQSQRKQISK
jgi:hypothetical protein